MANLYITEQKSVLRKTGDRLQVHKDDAVLLDVQCHKLDSVLIFGNVQFTTQALFELMEHNIELAILTRTGRLVGQLTSPANKNIELRLVQFRNYDNLKFCLNYSRSLISAKIDNSRKLVKAFSRNHPEVELDEIVNGLARYGKSVGTVQSIESLRGVEGTAARLYFDALSRMILTDLPFEGRRKRPPTDPVNALLSLGYTMLFNEIASLLDGLGFDPYLGFFHAVDYGRASLAADLMEPFRAPVTDHFTLNLLNLRMFTIDDFKENPRGKAVYLRSGALKRYFKAYESFMTQPCLAGDDGTRTTLRKCLRQQGESLVDALSKGTPFAPFIAKG